MQIYFYFKVKITTNIGSAPRRLSFEDCGNRLLRMLGVPKMVVAIHLINSQISSTWLHYNEREKIFFFVLPSHVFIFTIIVMLFSLAASFYVIP